MFALEITNLYVSEPICSVVNSGLILACRVANNRRMLLVSTVISAKLEADSSEDKKTVEAVVPIGKDISR